MVGRDRGQSVGWRVSKLNRELTFAPLLDLDFKSSEDLTRVLLHPQGHTRKLKTDERDIFNGIRLILIIYPAANIRRDVEGQTGAMEVRNDRALVAYNRVQNKLNGEL